MPGDGPEPGCFVAKWAAARPSSRANAERSGEEKVRSAPGHSQAMGRYHLCRKRWRRNRRPSDLLASWIPREDRRVAVVGIPLSRCDAESPAVLKGAERRSPTLPSPRAPRSTSRTCARREFFWPVAARMPAMRARRRCASSRDRAWEGARAQACLRQSGICGRPSLVL